MKHSDSRRSEERIKLDFTRELIGVADHRM